MSSIVLQPIGTIHSPFQTLSGMPIQPSSHSSERGQVTVLPDFAEGLVDLEGFSHITLLYYFHKAQPPLLTVTPYLDNRPHGVFATRSPVRPNPIGLSVVRLLSRDGTTLHIEGVDVLDGTPLIDIKPVVPDFDHPKVDRVGWLEDCPHPPLTTLSDDRFHR